MSTPPVPGSRDLPTRQDTHTLGRDLGGVLRAGDVVVLDGPLGAGKTALTGGLAAGLAVRGRVTSPTFVLARHHRPGYAGGPGMVHVDAYRLLGADESATPRDPAALLDELESLELDSELATGVVVVEWGAGLAEGLGERTLVVELRRSAGTERRRARWFWAADRAR